MGRDALAGLAGLGWDSRWTETWSHWLDGLNEAAQRRYAGGLVPARVLLAQ